MSLDIFVMTLIEDEDGRQLRFDRSVVEQAFASFALDQETDDWQLMNPDGEIVFAMVSVDLDPTITGFSIDRPPAMHTFWDAVYEVLRQTPTVVVWPGRDPSYCVAQRDYTGLVPEDYMKTFGAPVVATCGADILAAVEASV